MDLRSLVTSSLDYIMKVLLEKSKYYLYLCPFPYIKVVGTSGKQQLGLFYCCCC